MLLQGIPETVSLWLYFYATTPDFILYRDTYHTLSGKSPRNTPKIPDIAGGHYAIQGETKGGTES
jgi:hypothetical protein